MTRLLFFWDYDTQWGADRSRLPRAKDWGHLEFPCTDEILDVHREFGVRACFAVVGAAARPGTRPYHDPQQIRRIHDEGHEVASHAFAHEWLPALDAAALRRTLRDSKDALEQCIGGPVVTFVPPFNQPFDYAGGWSISLAERREAGRRRTTLTRLCDALGETGYRACRVAYAPLTERLAALWGAPGFRPGPPTTIRGITCVRVGPCGFDPAVVNGLRRRARPGAAIALYGHPHSIHGGDPAQSLDRFRAALALAVSWESAGEVSCVLPHQLVSRQAAPRHASEALADEAMRP